MQHAIAPPPPASLARRLSLNNALVTPNLRNPADYLAQLFYAQEYSD